MVAEDGGILHSPDLSFDDADTYTEDVSELELE